MIKVSPSLLSCDFSCIAEEIRTIDNSDLIHLDVMDGQFVPNISFGAPVISKIRKHTDILFDTHLMINEPIRYIKDFALAGSDYITFHIESTDKIQDTIDEIKKYDKLVGISIKPNTDVTVLDKYLTQLDMILIMSVEPGFGGQSFMENSLDKIKYLDVKRKESNYKYLINVDGGVNLSTGKMCVDNGADILVAGSFVFNSSDRKHTIEELKKI